MPSTVIAENKVALHTRLSKEAQLVRNALIEQGLETPMSDQQLTRDEKYDRIKIAMTEVAQFISKQLKPIDGK